MTAARRDLAGLPDWPLGLSLEQAAAFVGVSPDTFLRHCPVKPRPIGARMLYDRDKVAAWFKGDDVDLSKPTSHAPGTSGRVERIHATFAPKHGHAPSR